MASIGRMVVEWSGGAGLPGVSVLYNDGTSTAAIAELVTFFDAIKGYIPSPVSVTVPNSGDNIEDSTGTLIGAYSGGSGGTVTGTSSQEYAAGVGVAIQWNTAGIRNGRRVRGRTFLAPLTRMAFDTDGTLNSTARGVLQTAGDALAAGGNLVVWARPTPPSTTNGDSFVVTSCTVPDRATALRSRRY